LTVLNVAVSSHFYEKHAGKKAVIVVKFISTIEQIVGYGDSNLIFTF